MNRPHKRSVTESVKKPPTAEENKEKNQPNAQIKRTVARICCLRLPSTWTIRTQFMSSIFILNLIFLAIILACISVTLFLCWAYLNPLIRVF